MAAEDYFGDECLLAQYDEEPVELLSPDFTVKRETAKAWLVSFSRYGERRKEWFPKSQCTLFTRPESRLGVDVFQVPLWLWKAKGLNA